jgi:hypothetical protein
MLTPFSSAKQVSILKNYSVHRENYYNLWYSTHNYFQYNIYHQNFDKLITNKLMVNKYDTYIINSWEDIHDEWFIHNKYEHLSTLTFYEFFSEHQIDIPSCFKKSHSLLRPQRELTLISFITYFMRHGLKLKTQNLFISSLQKFFSLYLSPNYSISPIS